MQQQGLLEYNCASFRKSLFELFRLPADVALALSK
jgi:hypothetical protein